MNRILVYFALATAAVIGIGWRSQPIDTGGRIIKMVSPEVIALTPPTTDLSGGTGFAVRSLTGRVYTLTNSHVCGLADLGLMAAQLGGGRKLWLRVLEVSQTTDLCLLEALPGRHGLTMADAMDQYEPIYALGHPRLEPLTLSTGYFVGRGDVQLIDETPVEKCSGPSRRVENMMTLFGPVSACIRTIDAISTSLVIYPGSSGSPVVNASGELVGAVFAGANATNYGAMIPLDAIREFLSGY
jgi:S1-C subfamily serine protease